MIIPHNFWLGFQFVDVVDVGDWGRMALEYVGAPVLVVHWYVDCFALPGEVFWKEGDAPEAYCGVVITSQYCSSRDCYFCVARVVEIDGVFFKNWNMTRSHHSCHTQQVVLHAVDCVSGARLVSDREIEVYNFVRWRYITSRHGKYLV